MKAAELNRRIEWEIARCADLKSKVDKEEVLLDLNTIVEFQDAQGVLKKSF